MMVLGSNRVRVSLKFLSMFLVGILIMVSRFVLVVV